METDRYIDVSKIEQFEKSSGSEKNALKSVIVENILNNTLRFEDIPIASTSKLEIIYGDIFGDSKDDIVFIVSLGSKNSIAVGYERVKDKYEFKGLIGSFMKIIDIQMIRVTGSRVDFILIEEDANQMLGALEKAVYIKIYRWDKNKFEECMNFQKDYKSYWNEMYDKNKKDSRWLSIRQNASNVNKNDSYDKFDFKINQQYQHSKTTNSVNIPNDEDFDTLENKNFSKTYTWSDNWNHYILSQGIEIETGLIVAILEDLEQDPFSLIEPDKRYKIKRLDGTTSYVDKLSVAV